MAAVPHLRFSFLVSPSVPQGLGTPPPVAWDLAGLVAAVPSPRVQPPGSASTRLREPVTSCPAPSKPCRVAAPTATSEPWSHWKTTRAARRRRGTPRAGDGRCERGGAGGALPPGLQLPPLPLPTSAAAPGPSRPFSSVTPPICGWGWGVIVTQCLLREIPSPTGGGGAYLVYGFTDPWNLESRPVQTCLGVLCACHCSREAAAARCP